MSRDMRAGLKTQFDDLPIRPVKEPERIEDGHPCPRSHQRAGDRRLIYFQSDALRNTGCSKCLLDQMPQRQAAAE